MIRQAKPDEFLRIQSFYWQMIDDMQSCEIKPGWQKGVYPADDAIKAGLANGEMFLYEENGVILAAMRVNHSVTDGYDRVKWSVDALPGEVTVIHMLGVDVGMQGKGIAKEMVRFVIDKARSEGQKCLRLDVLGGNTPAFRLYESVGFVPVGTVQLFYEDTGLTDYVLYEYNL